LPLSISVSAHFRYRQIMKYMIAQRTGKVNLFAIEASSFCG